MRCVIVATLLIAARASADGAPPSDEPSAADVAAAPLPGAESGRLDAPPPESLVRTLGRGALFVPKVALEVAMAPARAGLWAYEKYRLKDRWMAVFFDETETYGLYPTAVLDSSYGLTVGGRFVHRDLFGRREHLALRGAGGGEFRARSTATFRTGERFGRLRAELRGDWERRPNDAFYGIGNLSDATLARHRQELLRATLVGDIAVGGGLHVRAATAVTDLEYGASDAAMPITDVYSLDALAGWMGVRNVYAELELRWDARRDHSRVDQHRVYEGGWLLAAYAGRVHQLEAGRDHWRYGAEVQHYIGVSRSPRVIASRLHVDGLTGEQGDAAFTELPQLGGRTTLRGYPRERFRDQIATVGSLEYQWDLGRLLMASLFVDAGHVFASWRDPLPRTLRVGYGVALQLHQNDRYRVGLSLASSVDGGVFFDLTFDPAFEIEPRVEQR